MVVDRSFGAELHSLHLTRLGTKIGPGPHLYQCVTIKRLGIPICDFSLAEAPPCGKQVTLAGLDPRLPVRKIGLSIRPRARLFEERDVAIHIDFCLVDVAEE